MGAERTYNVRPRAYCLFASTRGQRAARPVHVPSCVRASERLPFAVALRRVRASARNGRRELRQASQRGVYGVEAAVDGRVRGVEAAADRLQVLVDSPADQAKERCGEHVGELERRGQALSQARLDKKDGEQGEGEREEQVRERLNQRRPHAAMSRVLRTNTGEAFTTQV